MKNLVEYPSSSIVNYRFVFTISVKKECCHVSIRFWKKLRISKTHINFQMECGLYKFAVRDEYDMLRPSILAVSIDVWPISLNRHLIVKYEVWNQFTK